MLLRYRIFQDGYLLAGNKRRSMSMRSMAMVMMVSSSVVVASIQILIFFGRVAEVHRMVNDRTEA